MKAQSVIVLRERLPPRKQSERKNTARVNKSGEEGRNGTKDRAAANQPKFVTVRVTLMQWSDGRSPSQSGGRTRHSVSRSLRMESIWQNRGQIARKMTKSGRVAISSGKKGRQWRIMPSVSIQQKAKNSFSPPAAPRMPRLRLPIHL